MKYISKFSLFFFALVFFACNSGDKPETSSREMSFAAVMATPDSTVVTKNGDTIRYYSDTKTGTYSYKIPRITISYKGSVTPPDTIVVPPVDPIPGQTTKFTGNIIPFSEPDLIGPGRGAEQWHNNSARIPNPTPTSTTENSLDVYYRIGWREVQKDDGAYTWAKIDKLVKEAMDRGQKLSLGIMEHRPEDDADGVTNYDGAVSYYPLYLHKLMQAEPTNSRDWISNGFWIPNFNSSIYHAELEKLNKAVSDHLLATRYTPTSGPNKGRSVLMGDAIYCMDIRGFGTWGEWHTCCGIADTWTQFPAGRVPTAAGLIKIIDAHTKVLNNWPLTIMIAAYDGGSSQFGSMPPYTEVAWYALNARNGWGPVGYRKDQWASKEEYLKRLAENNNKTFGGSGPFKDYILNKYKEAPVTGEPLPGTYSDMSDLERQVRLYHATSVGNGNFGNWNSAMSTANQNFTRAAFKAAGYRIQIVSGSITTGTRGEISVAWHNTGVAPTYENWNVIYELRSGNSVVWTGTSTFKPKLFLPTAAPVTVVDNFSNIPTGNYSLVVKVVDPSGYRQPITLANRGRNTDGSYTLK